MTNEEPNVSVELTEIEMEKVSGGQIHISWETHEIKV